MTIEEKVSKILTDFSESQHLDNIGKGEFFDKDQAAQAILALIKPMSQKRLARIINSWWKNLSEKRRLSDVILAEWGKGLK